MGNYYKFHNCSDDIDSAQDMLGDLKHIVSKYLDLFKIDFSETIENVPNQKEDNYELKKFVFCLGEKIEELDSLLYSAKEEADDLQDKIDDLEDEISEYEDLMSLDEFNVERPSTYNETELLGLVLDVYNNKDRLDHSDVEILKVLSRKTL